MATFQRTHPVLHGLLGLTPLLAVSTCVVEALVFDAVLIAAVMLSSLLAGLSGLPGFSHAAPVLELAGGPLPLLARPAGGLLLLGCLFAACTLMTTDRQGETDS